MYAISRNPQSMYACMHARKMKDNCSMIGTGNFAKLEVEHLPYKSFFRVPKPTVSH